MWQLYYDNMTKILTWIVNHYLANYNFPMEKIITYIYNEKYHTWTIISKLITDYIADSVSFT